MLGQFPGDGGEFVKVVDGMIGDALQNIAQVGEGFNRVSFATLNQAVDYGRASSTVITTGEQPVLSFMKSSA